MRPARPYRCHRSPMRARRHPAPSAPSGIAGIAASPRRVRMGIRPAGRRPVPHGPERALRAVSLQLESGCGFSTMGGGSPQTTISGMGSDIVTHVLKEDVMNLTMQNMSGKMYAIDLVCEGGDEYLDGSRSIRDCSGDGRNPKTRLRLPHR